MTWRTRLLGFLLMCSALIGLNVIATLNGAYTSTPGAKGTGERLHYSETTIAVYNQP